MRTFLIVARPLKTDEPLVAFAFRVPAGVADHLTSRASALGVSRSDFIRRCIDLDQAQIDDLPRTGRPAPSSRRRELARPIRADPELLRQLAAIGNNLNQLARQVNASGWELIDRVELLAALQEIRFELDRLEP